MENKGWAITMAFNHLGGDPIDTSRTKLVTSWTNRTTNEVYYRETTALPYSETPQEYRPGKYVNFSLETVNVDYDYGIHTKYHEPYFVIPDDEPADEKGEEVSLWYGNFILKPGDVMKETMSINDGNHAYKDYSVVKEGLLLTGKDVVNVKLIDMPTGQIIFNKDIYVTEG
jgi:FlaG/FlaF family flagellin (archaellin)